MVQDAQADDAGSFGAGFGSVMEALRAGRAMVDYLNSPVARELDGAAWLQEG